MSRRGAILQDYGGHFEPMPLDSQLAAASYYQRDKEQANQLKYQREKENEADKYRKLKMIDDATDPSKYQSSAQKANSLATQQLLALRDEYAGKTNLQPEQLYLELQQRLTPVAQGYGSYKQALDEQEALAKKAAEVNPNLDVQKVLSDLQTEFDADYLTTNPDGTTAFNQAKIGTKSDALDRILRPENAWKYSKGSKGLMEVLRKGGEKGELFSQAPDKTQINYTTNVPFWAQVVDDKGQPLQADPSTGLLPQGKLPRVALKGTIQDYDEVDDKGRKVTKQMVVVPQKTMDAILYNDELKYQFEGDWQRHKREAGISVDPAREDDLKRIYFSQVLADNGLVQPYVSSRTHLPPQPRTTINNRYGGRDVPVMDIVTPVRKYLEANKDRTVTYDSNDGTRKELSGIAQLNTFTNEVTDPIVDKVKSRYPNTNAGQIYYRNIDGETWVVKAEEEGKINPEKDTIVFKLDDFSNVSGNKAQGQKSKNEALRRAQSGTKIDENTNQDLDPNGFKKEGKYWRYKDGRLFDDKGNVIKK